MAKLKNCPSCDKEVSTSAKVCPHCGKKLKMGLFLKLIIAIVVIGVAASILGPSAEEQASAFETKLNEITNAQPANLSPGGDLAELFSMMSKNTDLQRENKEKEIKGKIVDWTLPVFEVKKRDENTYKIQTSSRSDAVGTFVVVTTRSPEQVSYVEELTTGQLVRIKGTITGTL